MKNPLIKISNKNLNNFSGLSTEKLTPLLYNMAAKIKRDYVVFLRNRENLEAKLAKKRQKHRFSKRKT
ncbi:MAG: hypothetical protein KBT32_09260 [Bacteroidales bacterium]|nr:hypothetical protein [Candidatus Physcocola equi]